MSKLWKWVATAAAVLGAALLSFLAASGRRKADTSAAVDAAHSADVLKEASDQVGSLRTQIETLQQQQSKISSDEQTANKALETQRAAVAAGALSNDEIDRLLRSSNILK